MSPISNAPAFRRRACAVALPGIPLALLAASLVSPTDSTDNAAQLAAAAAHPGRWQASALLELLAAALFPLAVAGVVHLVRRRGAALAHLSALFGGLGALGMTSIACRHLFIYGLTAAGEPTALKVLDRVDDHAGSALMPLMIAGPVALILVAGAAARARLVSRWVFAGVVLFAVVDSLPIPAAEELQGVVGIAALGAIAVRLLRLTDEEWETPAAGTGAGSEGAVPTVGAHARA